MTAVNSAVAVASVAVLNKSSLKLVLDTGPNEKKLEELGLSHEYQRATTTRILEVNVQTGLPVNGATEAPTRPIDITGPLIAYGLITSVDGEFKMATICTQANTIYVVMIGKKVFHFVYDKTVQSATFALEALFTECLNRGPRGFENNNNMIPNFWEKLLTLLLPNGGTLEFGLFSRDKDYVPSRVYFTPGAKDHTLSIAGLCYNLDLNKFPRESINKGINKWKDEQAKQGKAVGSRVSLGDLIVPRGNKGKEKRPATPIAAAVLPGKSWEDLVKVHERTEAEKAGDKKRQQEVQAKKEARGGKPTTKVEVKAKAKK